MQVQSVVFRRPLITVVIKVNFKFILANCFFFGAMCSTPIQKERTSISFILGGSWYKTESVGEYGDYLTTQVQNQKLQD